MEATRGAPQEVLVAEVTVVASGVLLGVPMGEVEVAQREV